MQAVGVIPLHTYVTDEQGACILISTTYLTDDCLDVLHQPWVDGGINIGQMTGR